ncbi:hypothetical protein [Marinobacter sp.]|uniref:hypothetical protein n=1 Tax=Marinobacter sp. TaxID=50741 RepID=UPI0025C5C7CC|nr:hypothetical protein [Marinobacter sp.]|tara:strand:+ start:1734 stop:1892 length:159 start_codon:yes stop_codon:yes gene_type:complete
MFTNRVVWITGASSGTGEALAADGAAFGEEMAVLWVKRVAPEMMFKLARKQN